MHNIANETAALLLLCGGWKKRRQRKTVFQKNSSGNMEGITSL